MINYFEEYWYDKHPEVFEAEKCAMNKELKDKAIFFIRNGKYGGWHIYDDHEIELVYDEYGIRTYFVNPTIEEMFQLATQEYGVRVNAPGLMRDKYGKVCLVLVEGKDFQSFLEYPIVMEYYRRAKRSVYILEWNIRNPDHPLIVNGWTYESIKRIKAKDEVINKHCDLEGENFEKIADSSLEELIKRFREEVNLGAEDDDLTIKCACRRCQNIFYVDKDCAYRNKFFKCGKCGYVVEPIIYRVPKELVD